MAKYYLPIEEAASKAGLATYKFIVADSESWNDSQHKYRKSDALKITNIPTVGLFDGSKLTNILIESEIANDQQRNSLFAKFSS